MQDQKANEDLHRKLTRISTERITFLPGPQEKFSLQARGGNKQKPSLSKTMKLERAQPLHSPKVLNHTEQALPHQHLHGVPSLPDRTTSGKTLPSGSPFPSVLQRLVFCEQPETKFYWGDAREEGKQVNNRDHIGF